MVAKLDPVASAPGVEPPVVLDEMMIRERLEVLIPAALGNGVLEDIYRLDDFLLTFRPRDVQDAKLRKLVEAARDHVNTWTPETRQALIAAMRENLEALIDERAAKIVDERLAQLGLTGAV